MLVLIYHFAKVAEGDILEIGSFVGGSTVAAGLGVRDSGKRKKIISIDADSHVRRDIDCYGDRLGDGCWVVIDDYVSATHKGGPTRSQVDEGDLDWQVAGRLIKDFLYHLSFSGRAAYVTAFTRSR